MSIINDLADKLGYEKKSLRINSTLNTGMRLAEVLKFLEERKKGYKYSLNISFAEKSREWVVTIRGESAVDRSYPVDFLYCNTIYFEELPDAALIKAKELLSNEIKKQAEQANSLLEANKKLQSELELINNLQTKLNNLSNEQSKSI